MEQVYLVKVRFFVLVMHQRCSENGLLLPRNFGVHGVVERRGLRPCVVLNNSKDKHLLLKHGLIRKAYWEINNIHF